MSSFLKESEIEERLLDLLKYQKTLVDSNNPDQNKIQKIQQTIEYYSQLLKIKTPTTNKVETPKKQEISLQKLRLLAQENALKNQQTNSERKESIFSRTPQRISKSNSEIIYNEPKIPGYEQKHPELFYDDPEKKEKIYSPASSGSGSFLDPVRWGSAYNLIAEVTNSIGNSFKHSSQSSSKFLDLTPKKEENNVNTPKQDETVKYQIEQLIENPEIKEIEDTPEIINLEEDLLIKEINEETMEEEALKTHSQRELEKLEIEGVENLTAEQELELLEKEILQERVNEDKKQMFENDPSLFEIELSFDEEFKLLRKSFIQAVANVRKWKTEKYVDSDDPVVHKKKTTTGIIIELASGKKVVYCPITGQSKIYLKEKTVYKFRNTDHKEIIPKDSIINYKHHNGLYHVINADLNKNFVMAFYYLRSGACSKNFKDGSRIQALPNGTKILYLSDGIKETIFENGMKERYNPETKKREIFLKNGQKVDKYSQQ
eukprot:gene10347-2761_t